MPYKKKNYSKKKRGMKRYVPSNAALQKQISTLRNASEVKTHERYVDTFPNFNAEIFELAALQQGVQADFRIGNTIKAKSLLMKYKLNNPAGNVNGNSVRVIVFVDKEQSILTVDDYLAPIELGTGEATLSLRAEKKKFSANTLYDKVHDLQVDDRVKTVVKSFKLNKFMQYDTTSALPLKNSLKLLLIQNKNATDTTRAAFNSVFQLQYTDA